MDDTSIADAVERGLFRQMQLITSLSVAIIGGLFLFFLQIKLHNAQAVFSKTSTIVVEGAWLFYFSLGFSGLAILCGFLVSGMLIEVGPILFQHKFDRQKFSSQALTQAPMRQLRYLSIAQSIAFLLSVFFAVMSMLCNFP